MANANEVEVSCEDCSDQVVIDVSADAGVCDVCGGEMRYPAPAEAREYHIGHGAVSL